MRNELAAGFAESHRKANVDLRRTPRATPELDQVLGGFSTLWEGLDYAARGVTGFNFYSPRGALEHVLPYKRLRRQAIATGKRLIASGLRRGERVCVVAETGPEFMHVFFGCQYAGLVPCPMPYPMYIGGREAYIERIAGMVHAAHASAVIAPEDLADPVGEAAGKAGVTRILTHAELAEISTDGIQLEPFNADDNAYIQYSSGSTSAPKGVLITQKAICANTTGILRHGLAIRPVDRAFSWLPLYHDMGLVGFCLAAMMGQVTVDYLATGSFARRPALWLRLMSQNRSTVCYSPSFGYDLVARRIAGKAGEFDLSQWRIAGIGGDMVRAEVLEDFADKLAPAGFDRRAFLPSYGMAETTLAVTFADLDSDFRIDVIDREAMKTTARAIPVADIADNDRARRLVTCGRPLPGHELRLVDDHGAVITDDRRIGRIEVAGPSLMAGYYRNRDATAEIARDDGFFDTGDMGYWLDGEIVITGRAKDLILHNGRNIWPQDIEWAVERIEPLRDGDVAAFAIDRDGRDEIVVLVHCRLKDAAAMEDLRRKVQAQVHSVGGVECKVVLIAPKSLPFTSSGKLSRAGARERYLSGAISEISPAVESFPVAQPGDAVELAVSA